jgi:AI-2 transport protein TqsA
MEYKNPTLEQYLPIINVCLLILSGVALTAFLVYTKTVLMPFVIAVFISMVSNTFATWMKEKWGVPRMLGLVLAVLFVLGLAGIAIMFVSNAITVFMAGATNYAGKISESLNWAVAIAQKIGIKINQNFISEYIANIPAMNIVTSMGGWLISLFTTLSLVTLFVIFIFMGHAAQDNPFLSNIERQISKYLMIKFFVSLLAGGLTWIILASAGTPLAATFAFLTFVLNFIPNVGPFIATLLPAPVLFLTFGPAWQIPYVLITLTVIHFLVGNILETKLLGKGMDLSPVVVIASLIFWALVWGAMGALLAVPLTSVIKIILERSEPTKPLAQMLAGRLPFK